MARQIVKLPNGLYGMWSTISDSFLIKDLTKKEYIEYRAKEVYFEEIEELTDAFKNEKDGRYFMDYAECMEILLEQQREE